MLSMACGVKEPSPDASVPVHVFLTSYENGSPDCRRPFGPWEKRYQNPRVPSMMLRMSPWQFAGVTAPLVVFVPAGVFWFTGDSSTEQPSFLMNGATAPMAP